MHNLDCVADPLHDGSLHVLQSRDSCLIILELRPTLAFIVWVEQCAMELAQRLTTQV